MLCVIIIIIDIQCSLVAAIFQQEAAVASAPVVRLQDITRAQL